eukprot:Hpha_TRINITY_DN34408_c0_g1::TRINITY_DN34408_c0_g1_i1::g.96158::m.96158
MLRRAVLLVTRLPLRGGQTRRCGDRVSPSEIERFREMLRAANEGDETEWQGGGEEAKIPVTVITGFLGAGKTTLLNHILKQPHGKKLGIIENEYGEVGIDDALVPREKGEEEKLFELNNGCVCCTVRGDLVRILGRLASRKLDGVIVETTGLANPLPIAQTFFQDEAVADRFELDGIITVVDARHVERHLDTAPNSPHVLQSTEVPEAVAQVALADRILVNKTDLVDDAALERVTGRLRSINSVASILHTSQSEVSADVVLKVGGFDPNRVAAEEEPRAHSHSHSHSHGHSENHSHGHSHAKHDPSRHLTANLVTSVGLTHSGDLVPAAVRYWLDEIIERYGDDLYRHKGVVSVRGVDDKFVFQGVHQLSAGPARTDIQWGDGDRVSRAVFIGKGLDREFIEAGLQQCMAPKDLRFKEGDTVVCRFGSGWRTGRVEGVWESEYGYPYMIRFPTGEEAYLAFDSDDYIRVDDPSASTA